MGELTGELAEGYKRLMEKKKKAEGDNGEQVASDPPIDTSSSRKWPPEKASVKSASFPVDFSEVLTAIDIQLSRLGWGQEQVTAFLKQMYGQTSRSLLRDEELMDFKEQLLAL